MAARGFDLGIRVGRRPSDAELVASRIADSPRLVCCSPDYAAQRGLSRGIADLAAPGGIGYSGMGRPDVWSFIPRRRNRGAWGCAAASWPTTAAPWWRR